MESLVINVVLTIEGVLHSISVKTIIIPLIGIGYRDRLEGRRLDHADLFPACNLYRSGSPCLGRSRDVELALEFHNSLKSRFANDLKVLDPEGSYDTSSAQTNHPEGNPD